MVRPVPFTKLKLLPLTDLWASCWTHYSGKTTFCPGPLECDCFDVKGEVCSRRWAGWLPCIQYHAPRRCILALTPGMADILLGWRDQAKGLRGWVLGCERTDARANAPVGLWREELYPTRGVLPEPFDPTWSVLAVLGLDANQIQGKRDAGYTMMARDAGELVPQR